MQDIHRFMGVYSSNELTPPLSYPTYIIANFSRAYEKGTHFIAILFLKERSVYLFRSAQPFIHSQRY